MENVLDILDNWCSNNHLIATGIVLLVAAFILSFCFKTFWGEWKGK